MTGVNGRKDIMNTKKVKLSEVKLPSYNPRTMPKEELENLKRSIKRFGYVEPIVINRRTGHVVGGNQRVIALRELGFEEAEAVEVDLSLQEEKALNLALNKISGEWDIPKLKEVLLELKAEDFDIELTGFDINEITDLLALSEEPHEDDFNFEEAEEQIAKPITKRGDIWKLGRHRLMCGDATLKEDVNKLLNGQSIDLVFTDPPYGINVVKGKHIGGGGIIPSNEYLPVIGDESTETAEKAYKLCREIGIENFVIWGGNYFTGFLPPSRCWVCWDKIDGLEGTTKNFSDIELAWTSYSKPARIVRHRWQGLMKASEHNQKRVHPTQKPIALVVECFELFNAGRNILDLFGGSGSTLIACEQTDRVCYMMELSEKYCDVIIKRWEEYTGEEAELLQY